MPTLTHHLVAAAGLALCVSTAGRSVIASELGEARGTYDCMHGKHEYAAWSAAPVDESTGRDLRNFPPDRVVDFVHMKLELHFEDLETPMFTATESLRFVPLGSGTSSLALDATGLMIDRVSLGSSTVDHYRDDDTLTLRFDPPLATGVEHEVVIQYTCEQPWAGLFFTPSAPDAPGYTAEVHTQGQTTTNHHWFVCHDSPNERLTTELIVNVPAAYSVSSNGHLVSSIVNGDRAVWHWLQDKPHVNYLVSLVIGQFDIVEIPHDRVPMKVWVPKGKGSEVLQSYGRTGAMIDVFEQRLGVAYPWDRYDQILAKNFRAGGMENTSVTTMYPTAVLDERALLDGDLEGLIAHELAHQWTGDLITCKGWAHIWLNEGWATYGSALWFEARDGEDGYLDSIRGNFRRVTRRDRTSNEIGMVSPVYDHPGETFGRAANPYPKGASILHMLRCMLGEEVFWSGVHLYMNRHSFGEVETNDFRYAMEEVSGRGLEWFFEQWCYRPGVPELDVRVRYDAHDGGLVIDVTQTQQIDARTPAFRFDLPIEVTVDGVASTHQVRVTERETGFRVALDGVPSLVVVDPRLAVLKKIEVDKPREMWLQQARTGPTIASRHAALEMLGTVDTARSIEVLAAVAHDDSVRHTLRSTAVGALDKLGSAEAKGELLALARADVAEARVRLAVIRAVADHDKDDVADLLAAAATGDASYAVRAAAIDGLAGLECKEHADIIVELVDYPSQHEQVRNAALSALADLDDERGLDLAIRYAAYGNPDRARPRAISAIGTLAKHDPDRAYDVLVALLHDPEGRTVRAAGSALAATGDERCLPALESIAESHANPRLRRSAERWVKRIEDGEDGDDEDQPRRRRRQ